MPMLSPFELNKEPVKLEKQRELILRYFDGEGKLSFNNLISILNSRLEVIVTFLAILDLIKLSLTSIKDDQIRHDHILINEEINLNERF